MFVVRQYTGGGLVRLLASFTTTVEAVQRGPQRETIGAKAEPTPTGHIPWFPSGGAFKIYYGRVAISFFQTARSARPHGNRPNEADHEYSRKSRGG